MDTNNKYPLKIVSFPDDYLETIFLMKFYEELLKKYPKVEIDLIPRSIRCSNDAAYFDVLEFTKHFPTLNNELRSRNRFRINKNGPKLGGLNLFKIHPEVLEIIKSAFIVDVRGARNYEMMQGINKQAFFGFAVCRDFSVSTTGLLPDNAPLVYIHQTPKQYSFKGFTKRNKRMKINNGKNYYLSEVTVTDNSEKWNGGHLASRYSWNTDKQERFKMLRKFYSSNAIEFDKKWGGYLESDVGNILEKLSGRVLVLGCGSGKEVEYLQKRSCDVYGVDFSSEAILLAKTIHPQIEDRFFVEDFYNVRNIMDKEFDGIVANASLLHLLDRNDLTGILKDIHSRLKPKGHLFLRLIKKYEETEIRVGELKRILGKNLKLLHSIDHNNNFADDDQILKFDMDNIEDLKKAYKENGNRIVKRTIEELLKFSNPLEFEIDDREQGSLRWFTYYTEDYLNGIFSNLFEVKRFELKDHISVPTVKWLSYLLQKR